MKKQTIKSFFFSFILMLSTLGLNAQFRVVYDPVSDANLKLINTTLISNASLQTGYLSTTATQAITTATAVVNTLAILDKMEQALLKVNEVLTTTIMVKNIIQREREILRMQQEIGQNLQKFKNLSPEELQIINNQLLVAVRTTEAFIGLAYDILARGFFKMDDNARMSKFFDIDKQLAIQQSIMKAYYVQYTIIDEERAIISAARRK